MEKEILQNVSDALLEKSITIEVDVFAQSFIHKKLQSFGICQKKRTFIIRPITLGSLIRISKLLLSVDVSTYDLKNWLESSYKALNDHTETLCEIVSIAIQNNKQEPSKELKRFILNHFTSDELMNVLGVVVKQMDVLSFMRTIILAKGMSVLEQKSADAVNADQKMSPMSSEEIIASGEQLAE